MFCYKMLSRTRVYTHACIRASITRTGFHFVCDGIKWISSLNCCRGSDKIYTQSPAYRPTLFWCFKCKYWADKLCNPPHNYALMKAHLNHSFPHNDIGVCQHNTFKKSRIIRGGVGCDFLKNILEIHCTNLNLSLHKLLIHFTLLLEFVCFYTK